MAIGFERTYLGDEKSFAVDKTGTLMIGIGTPGVEAHVGGAYTSVHKLGRPFEALDELYMKIMGW